MLLAKITLTIAIYSPLPTFCASCKLGSRLFISSRLGVEGGCVFRMVSCSATLVADCALMVSAQLLCLSARSIVELAPLTHSAVPSFYYTPHRVWCGAPLVPWWPAPRLLSFRLVVFYPLVHPAYFTAVTVRVGAFVAGVQYSERKSPRQSEGLRRSYADSRHVFTPDVTNVSARGT